MFVNYIYFILCSQFILKEVLLDTSVFMLIQYCDPIKIYKSF